MSRRLAVPVTAIVLGLVAWLAQAVGGDPRGGLISFAIMSGYGVLVLVLARRSDIAAVLAGNAPDERFRAIDERALAATGVVLVLFVVGGFLWEQAHGRSGMPFTVMGAVGAITYLAGIVYGRWRG